VGVVVDDELTGADLLDQGGVLVLGEGLEAPAGLGGGQADIVAFLQAVVAVGAADGIPGAARDMLNGVGHGHAQALHGGGQERVVAVRAVRNALFADIVLVDVNADDLAVVLDSGLNGAGG